MKKDIRILKAQDVESLLAGRELEIINTIQAAYELHAYGSSVLPYSTILHFDDTSADHMIALPAYLGEDFAIVGMKWLASFPRNVEQGLEHESAVMVVNSVKTGHPVSILEGSIINVSRSAGSAALAARYLRCGRKTSVVGVIGCGLINLEIVRFLRIVLPDLEQCVVYDTDPQQATLFKLRCQQLGMAQVTCVEHYTEVLATASLVSLATTTVVPYIGDLSMCVPGTTILHISLRDLTPQVILNCDNVVDDGEHVCRGQTSLHLAEQLVGNRDFIRCTLADITRGLVPLATHLEGVTVFSPSGLGVLDLALAKLVLEFANEQNQGMILTDFLA